MLKKLGLRIFRFLFARSSMASLNKTLYVLSLKGLGILNYESHLISGENWFLRKVAKMGTDFTALDIGANEGEYSTALKKLAPGSKIYSFEPHPKTFSRLEERSKNIDYVPINAAVSDKAGEIILFDYVNSPGSSHASIYGDSIRDLRQSEMEQIKSKAITIDDFVSERSLTKIRLVKIDTEGHELKVLMGGKRSFETKVIDIVHFEFNEMNVFSKTFMRDFYDFLPEFEFYRLLPNGLLPLGDYNVINCEIFLFQNIVAIRKGIKI